MTPVEFHFVLPTGEPFANSAVQVQLAASTYTNLRDGIAVPREINFVTDADGRARLDLWPSTTIYYVSVQDAASDAGLSYKFIVPEVTPGTVLRVQDLVVNAPMSGTFYDDEALLAIQDAKAHALASAASAAAVAAEMTALLTSLGLEDGVLGGVTDGNKGDVDVVGGVWNVPGLTTVAEAAAVDATTKATAARITAITTAAGDATSKANTAQATAISTAAVDATTKASAAQAAAIASASTDATGKASAAQTAAIAVAAADATSKVSNRLLVAEKGVAGGVAPLGTDSKVPAAYLPSYVDEVQEYPNLGSFPVVGQDGVIYLRTDVSVNAAYRWSGTQYFPITDSPGSTDAVPEGASNLYFSTTRARVAAVQAGAVVASTVVAPNATAVIDAVAAGVTAAAVDATTKATNARTAAIATAATDASTKATAAQNAAVSAAAADATTKANAAAASATAAAALDATTKANAARDAAIATTSALITFRGVYRGLMESEALMLALSNPVIGDKVKRSDLEGQVFEVIALPATNINNWLMYGGGSASSSLDQFADDYATEYA